MSYSLEWDPKKAASNLKDHDVSFEEASLPSGPDFSERGAEVAIRLDDHYIVNPRSTVVLLAR